MIIACSFQSSHSLKMGKPNNLEVFVSKNTKMALIV